MYKPVKTTINLIQNQADCLAKQQGNARENGFYLLYFLVVCLGGALRKWVFSSGTIGNIVLLIQLLLPFLMVAFRSHHAVSPFRNYKIIGLFFFYLLLQVFNPLQQTIYHGILGMLVHGGIWLAFFFYLSNRHLFNISKYYKLILLLATGEIILAFVQYQLPADHFLNKYALDVINSIALVGDSVRVTGTFSYLSGYTAFTILLPFFIWALFRWQFNSWIVASLSVFGLIATFMTGSRSGVLLYIMLIAPIFMQEFTRKKFLQFVGKLILPIFIGIMLLLLTKKVTLVEQIEKAYSNFVSRVEAGQRTGEQIQRLTWVFSIFENSQFKYPFFGIGTGATYQGATILFGKSPEVTAFGYVEEEAVKIMLEGGLVLLLFKVLLITIFVSNLVFKGLIKWVIWIILLYGAPIVYNPHNAAFLFLGITLVDNIIWRQQMGFVAKKRHNAAPLMATDIVTVAS